MGDIILFSMALSVLIILIYGATMLALILATVIEQLYKGIVSDD